MGVMVACMLAWLLRAMRHDAAWSLLSLALYIVPVMAVSQSCISVFSVVNLRWRCWAGWLWLTLGMLCPWLIATAQVRSTIQTGLQLYGLLMLLLLWLLVLAVRQRRL
jgi:hypothetical protein